MSLKEKIKDFFKKVKNFFLKVYYGENYIKYIYRRLNLFSKYKLTSSELKLLKVLETDSDVKINKMRGVGSTMITEYHLINSIFNEKITSVCIMANTLNMLRLIQNELLTILNSNYNVIKNFKPSNGNVFNVNLKDGRQVSFKLGTYNEYKERHLNGYRFDIIYFPEFNSSFFKNDDEILDMLTYFSITSEENRMIIELNMMDDNFSRLETLTNAFLNDRNEGGSYISYDMMEPITEEIKDLNNN